MNNKYKENVKGLKKINGSDIENLAEGAFIYFGRGTCRFCREFSEEFPNIDFEIYYVDTEHTSVDEGLQEVRNTYEVATVPTFIYREKDGSFKKLNRDVRQSINDFVTSVSK